jgi:hypothetical protein
MVVFSEPEAGGVRQVAHAIRIEKRGRFSRKHTERSFPGLGFQRPKQRLDCQSSVQHAISVLIGPYQYVPYLCHDVRSRASISELAHCVGIRNALLARVDVDVMVSCCFTGISETHKVVCRLK